MALNLGGITLNGTAYSAPVVTVDSILGAVKDALYDNGHVRADGVVSFRG
jgi:hypothetical protein